ncbi:MAG: PDZ domain-containing protein [Candidatus Latescibacterota bacterium]|nr:MAG: PDZ domain-containing protein [Candidatus Latescibacterota bacterium]
MMDKRYHPLGATVGALLTLACVLPLVLAASPSLASSTTQGAQSIETPYIGLLVAPLSIDIRIKYGLLLTDPGARVIGIDRGSPAERARLRKDDFIISANGKLVREQADLQDVVLNLTDSTRVHLLVRRGNEQRVLVLQAVNTTPGYLGFGVLPRAQWESMDAPREASLTPSESVPVVGWVHPDMRDVLGEKLQEGSIILELNGRETPSFEVFEETAEMIPVGGRVSIRFSTYGENHTRVFRAQSNPRPRAGLRLEEISPALIEQESLTVDAVNAGGLYVRSVDKGSAAERASLEPRDQILRLGDNTVSSLAAFREAYERLSPGVKTPLRVWRNGIVTDSLMIESASKIPFVRQLPGHEEIIGLLGKTWYRSTGWGNVDWFPVFPIPYWNKVRGWGLSGWVETNWWRSVKHERQTETTAAVHRPTGLTDFDASWLSERWNQYHVDWTYTYGFGNKRMEHWVNMSFPHAWLPTVTYEDALAPFHNEEIANAFESIVLGTIAGNDRLSWVYQRGWILDWWAPRSTWSPHRLGFELGFVRQSAAMGDRTWLFDQKNSDPNPVEEVASGRFHTATVRYHFGRHRPRDWTQTSVYAEARFAGGALGGDEEYVRGEVDFSQSIRARRHGLMRRVFFDGRCKLGAASDNVPLQESFYVGGPHTLPGYDDRQFIGDQIVLLRASCSVAPLGNPENYGQLRMFAGFNAGNAWVSDLRSGIPMLRQDIELGLRLSLANPMFGMGFFVDLPVDGISLSIARPIDVNGDWITRFTIMGGGIRWPR